MGPIKKDNNWRNRLLPIWKMLVTKTETLFSGKLNKTSTSGVWIPWLIMCVFGIAGPFDVLLDSLKMRRFPDVLSSKSLIFNGIYKSQPRQVTNKHKHREHCFGINKNPRKSHNFSGGFAFQHLAKRNRPHKRWSKLRKWIFDNGTTDPYFGCIETSCTGCAGAPKIARLLIILCKYHPWKKTGDIPFHVVVCWFFGGTASETSEHNMKTTRDLSYSMDHQAPFAPRVL